jgi:hypothetical protein
MKSDIGILKDSDGILGREGLKYAQKGFRIIPENVQYDSDYYAARRI